MYELDFQCDLVSCFEKPVSKDFCTVIAANTLLDKCERMRFDTSASLKADLKMPIFSQEPSQGFERSENP
jgi:hypothetical protein